MITQHCLTPLENQRLSATNCAFPQYPKGELSCEAFADLKWLNVK